jgi:brefeldin A-resistance guanine nucleotide exchange factor 1
MLRDLKQVKQTLVTAIEKFNTESIDSSFKFLQENGLLPTPLDVNSVAQLLRFTPGLNKKIVGIFFGEPAEFNIAALRSYISAFVVEYHSEHYSSLVSTVRAFMESFRLPGEAQKISRIFENFGQIYYDYHSKRSDLSPGEFPFESPDGIFVMCFSIAMLNTDQHSAHVKVDAFSFCIN